MSATRRFNEAATLQAIMEVFWRKGFERTSIEDLESETGVKRGSLYNAFGSKQELFLRVFDQYSRTIEDSLLACLDHADVGEAIADMLQLQLRAFGNPALPSGCLIANCLVELNDTDEGLSAAIRKRMSTTENVIFDRLVAAQAAGQIAPGQDVRALARFAIAVIRILPILYQATKDQRYASDVARVALQVFDRGRCLPPGK